MPVHAPPLLPATLEAVVAATDARKDPEFNVWKGHCRVCDQADKLWVHAYADGEAVVMCQSGRCSAEDIGHALGLGPDVLIQRGVNDWGDPWSELIVAHSQHIPGENRVLNPVAALMLDSTALAALPKPSPLIADTLDRQTFALLVGYFGTGKSFIALDWAASIATGSPWMGRATEKGRVLYVLGEGVHGIHDRLTAWETHHGRTIEAGQLVVTRAPVQVADPTARGHLIEAVRDGDFSLVIFDTLARVAVGLEENSAKDMGVLVAAVDEVRRAMTDGTVLMVHHTGKDKGDVRGSSSLGGAADTYYLVKGDGKGTLTLDRKKRKDGPMADFLPLELKPVANSVVVVQGEFTGHDDTRQRMADDIREFLRAHGESTKTAIRDAISGTHAIKPQVLARMVELNLLAFDGRKYDLSPADKQHVSAGLPPLPLIVWADQPESGLDFEPA